MGRKQFSELAYSNRNGLKNAYNQTWRCTQTAILLNDPAPAPQPTTLQVSIVLVVCWYSGSGTQWYW